MTSTRASTRAKPEPEPRVHILEDGTIEAVAKYINDGKAKKIIVMTGAGISTAAGIKDFRSPGTGLYDDLERFNLPYPEAVFDIGFFKKGLLLRSYTQNIDMLERLAGVDEELLVEAHGSFAASRCIQCEVLSDQAWVRKHILQGEIPYCKRCGGLVKPTITFFGEELPPRFGQLAMQDFKHCDLLIVMGTSLQVEPFNRLITRVSSSCPRILINRDRAGEFLYSGFDFDDQWNHKYRRDALYLGSCDDGVRKLVQLCGWESELQDLYDAGHKELALAEELEALALEKELAAERKNKGKDDEDDEDQDDDDADHKEANGVKQDTDGLVEITQLLESTELSSTSTETRKGQTITETTKVTETTVVETQEVK
ncbi:NAD-dependent protein deacetylase sirtuin-2 [Mortierella sp. NVP85]|nr:NAD-dependent protein deacetylase sirtuin-2 [Mortierella sp. NVP85]